MVVGVRMEPGMTTSVRGHRTVTSRRRRCPVGHRESAGPRSARQRLAKCRTAGSMGRKPRPLRQDAGAGDAGWQGIGIGRHCPGPAPMGRGGGKACRPEAKARTRSSGKRRGAIVSGFRCEFLAHGPYSHCVYSGFNESARPLRAAPGRLSMIPGRDQAASTSSPTEWIISWPSALGRQQRKAPRPAWSHFERTAQRAQRRSGANGPAGQKERPGHAELAKTIYMKVAGRRGSWRDRSPSVVLEIGVRVHS